MLNDRSLKAQHRCQHDPTECCAGDRPARDPDTAHVGHQPADPFAPPEAMPLLIKRQSSQKVLQLGEQSTTGGVSDRAIRPDDYTG